MLLVLFTCHNKVEQAVQTLASWAVGSNHQLPLSLTCCIQPVFDRRHSCSRSFAVAHRFLGCTRSAGFEPATCWLTASRSTVELRPIYLRGLESNQRGDFSLAINSRAQATSTCIPGITLLHTAARGSQYILPLSP